MPVKILPSAEYLRACFEYDPATGVLMWQVRPREHFASTRAWRMRTSKFAGKEAGGIHHTGYRIISLDDCECMAHRLIWKWMTGEEPPKTIDHIDGDKANNRWLNLRPATQTEQCWNRGRVKNNRSGYKGIYQKGKKWRAEIRVNGVRRCCGLFDTMEEAAAAYEAAARERHGEFYRHHAGGKPCPRF